MANLEIDDQVREVIELMLADRWEPGTSHLAFMRKWGVSMDVVWRRASEASRFIRLCSGDEQQIALELVQNVRRIGRKAEDAEDYRSALGAQELRMRVQGMLDRKPSSDGDAVEQLPVEQLAAALRALGHEVKLNGEPRTEPAPAPTGSEEGPERVEGFLEGGEED